MSTTSSYTVEERRNQYFVNKKIKYVWDDATLVFVKLKSIDESMMQVSIYCISIIGCFLELF